MKLSRIISVSDVVITKRIIENFSIEVKSAGKLNVRRLKLADAEDLYNFYFQGLSEESRDFFPPYPLFSPPVESAEELANRIRDWQREDDWTVLALYRDECMLGIGLLKRCSTNRPASGMAIREDFQRMGLGFLMLTSVHEQARLWGIRKIYDTVAQENNAALELDKKMGYKKTGRLIPHYTYRNGNKVVDRNDIELERDIN